MYVESYANWWQVVFMDWKALVFVRQVPDSFSTELYEVTFWDACFYYDPAIHWWTFASYAV